MNGYGVFLTIELARAYGLIDNQLEYDLTWNKGCTYYRDYVKSDYNDPERSEYDCISDYLKTKIDNQITETV